MEKNKSHLTGIANYSRFNISDLGKVTTRRSLTTNVFKAIQQF